MEFPTHFTKIVCTIGPASNTPEMLQRLIEAGMDIARLNFSHGTFEEHAEVIAAIRDARTSVGRRVAIMADLPGPKIRIGELVAEDLELEAGATITLTTETVVGDAQRLSVEFPSLPDVVQPGHRIYINDGTIELQVTEVRSREVECRAIVGGELRSRKGLNLPGVDLGISAFTARDHECLQFALEHGVDAVSQSFVATAADVHAVREAAAALGHSPFVIAKIERAQATTNIHEILEAVDGIMIARGDLGVEIPIQRIALVQKELMSLAGIMGTPVITATHMLESMVDHRRPTRAEATDVANAILDGTDAVMLSAESAIGRFPVESVEMLANIAAATEPHRPIDPLHKALESHERSGDVRSEELIALAAQVTLERLSPEMLLVPTDRGSMPRSISRFRMPVWITALSEDDATCQHLVFSWGVAPVRVQRDGDTWYPFVRRWLDEQDVRSGRALLVQGPTAFDRGSPHRMEIIELERQPS